MKSVAAHTVVEGVSSLPTRGAWIEIFFVVTPVEYVVSLPTRGAWIEIESSRA